MSATALQKFVRRLRISRAIFYRYVKYALLLGPMLTFDKPHRPRSEGHSCIPTRRLSRYSTVHPGSDVDEAWAALRGDFGTLLEYAKQGRWADITSLTR